MPELTSLLEFLTIPNPVLENCRPKRSGNTRSDAWPGITQIDHWVDFNAATLFDMYSDVLKQRFKTNGLPRFVPPELDFCDEDSLEGLLPGLTRWPVCGALNLAQRILQAQGSPEQCPVKLQMRRGGQAQHPPHLRPDWAGVLQGCHQNILPGDSKPGKNWSSSKLVMGKVDRTDYRQSWMWPLRQVSAYCNHFGSRYGYILTEREVVALRLSRIPQDGQEPGVKLCKIEIKSIPWEIEIQEADNFLTVNLALWWLHMLAIGDISIQTSYPPLSGFQLTSRRETPQQHQIFDFSSSSSSSNDGRKAGTKRRAEAADEIETPRKKAKESIGQAAIAVM